MSPYELAYYHPIMILFVIFAGIILIILAPALRKHIEHRTKGSVSNDAEERLNERMDELERRLTDVQDILITIDEKFDRSPIAR